jgi:hypothetical protein
MLHYDVATKICALGVCAATSAELHADCHSRTGVRVEKACSHPPETTLLPHTPHTPRTVSHLSPLCAAHGAPCRILDFKQLQYEQKQKQEAVDKQRRLQQKMSTPKEMQFSARIAGVCGQQDLQAGAPDSTGRD